MEKHLARLTSLLNEIWEEAKREGADERSAEIYATLRGQKTAVSKPRSAAFNEAKAAILAKPKSKAKRTTEELEQTVKALTAYVKKHPDQRIEDIAKGMGVTTKTLTYPMQQLLEAKTVSRKGERRATTYKIKE